MVIVMVNGSIARVKFLQNWLPALFKNKFFNLFLNFVKTLPSKLGFLLRNFIIVLLLLLFHPLTTEIFKNYAYTRN